VVNLSMPRRAAPAQRDSRTALPAIGDALVRRD
jgi:hypothetical protein